MNIIFQSQLYINKIIYFKVYKGCFIDYTGGQRDLTTLATVPSNGNTPDVCINKCYLKNYNFAGLQNGYI